MTAVIAAPGLVQLPTASGRSAEELRELATEAGLRLEGARAEDVVRWAADTFGERFCVTSSFADAVLIHVVSRVFPGVDVVFLDTGLHFPETLRVRDQVAATMPVNVRSIRPRLTVGQQDGVHGPRLFSRDPDACCALRGRALGEDRRSAAFVLPVRPDRRVARRRASPGRRDRAVRRLLL